MKEFKRERGHDLIYWNAVGVKAPDGQVFDGNGIFVALYRAIDALASESLEGVEGEDVFNVVADLTKISEMLFDARNTIRKSKGLVELTVDQCLTPGNQNPK